MADDVLNQRLAGTYPPYLVLWQEVDGDAAVIDAGDRAAAGTAVVAP